MKTTREGNGTRRLLLALTWLQAALIATLLVLLLRRGDEEVPGRHLSLAGQQRRTVRLHPLCL